jgi:uncharacterized membrane protein
VKPNPAFAMRSGLSLPGVAAILAAVLATATFAGPALADLKLCNKTSSRIGVAIGYSDDKGWTTEGWWTVPALTCETLYKGALTNRYWYLHAIDYDAGGAWSGEAFMCTTDKAFTIKGVQDCAKRGYNKTGFLEVDTQKAADWTIHLIEDSSEGGGKAK